MLVAGCAFVLLAKLALIWRIGVNWDEFFFLSHVHSLLRVDLTLLLQGATFISSDGFLRYHRTKSIRWSPLE